MTSCRIRPDLPARPHGAVPGATPELRTPGAPRTPRAPRASRAAPTPWTTGPGGQRIDEDTALIDLTGAGQTWWVYGRQQVWMLADGARLGHPSGAILTTP